MNELGIASLGCIPLQVMGKAMSAAHRPALQSAPALLTPEQATARCREAFYRCKELVDEFGDFETHEAYINAIAYGVPSKGNRNV